MLVGQFSYATNATTKSHYGQVPDVFLLDDVHCTGSENSLFDCPHSTVDNCGPGEGAGAVCANITTNLTITLRGGSTLNEGNVFVYSKPVCDDYWDYLDAVVACKMLGYTTALGYTVRSHYGLVPSEFSLDNVDCDGTEESLLDCPHLSIDNCGSTEGAGVVCGDIPANNTVTSPHHPSPYPASTHQCWVQAPSPGQTVSLLFPEFELHDSVSDDLASYITVSPSINGRSKFWGRLSRSDAPPSGTNFPQDEQVTLCFYAKNNTQYKGFKAVFFDTTHNLPPLTEGTIITEPWAVLQSPNYPAPYPPNMTQCWVRPGLSCLQLALTFTTFNVSEGDIVSTSPAIQDSIDSSNPPPVYTEFNTGEGVTLCFRSIAGGSSGFSSNISTILTPPAVELQGGQNNLEGNLFINSKPVCDDSWDLRDADVACRMLVGQFSYATNATTKSHYGQVPDVFLLDDVHCTGSENSLFDCPHSTVDNCGPGEGAGAVCANITTNLTITLRGGSTLNEGNVFVYSKPVCDDYWDYLDAVVACKMLGYTTALGYTVRSHYGLVPSEFSLDNVDCDGTEESLLDCPHLSIDNCGSTEGAGVVCGDIPANNTVTSPHHPSPYPASTHQCWVQAPSPGQTVSLLFPEFELHDSVSDDLASYITVSPSINGRSKFWGRLSRSDAPPSGTNFPQDEQVTLCFYAKNNTQYKGFKAVFFDTTHNLPPLTEGTIITEPWAVLQSPNYPAPYPPNMTQCWVRPGLSCLQLALTFTTFNVSEGDIVSTSPAIQDSIDSSNPPPVYTEFNTGEGVTLCFRSTVGGSSGFSANISIVSEEAGPAEPSQCRCGVPNRVSRIVGGVETMANEYPWQVGLVFPGRSVPFCGGSVLSSKTILTAAHCTEGKAVDSFQVLVGEHDLTQEDGQQRVEVCSIEEHPGYTSSNNDHDLSILTLSSPLQMSRSVSPVCLPPLPPSPYTGVVSTVSGWGTLSSGGSQPDRLMEVNVTVIDNTECRAAYGSTVITDSMICARDMGKDSCQGDSGGPLVTLEASGYYSLIGVVSWGYGCANPLYPGVYARVTEDLPWIGQNIRGTTCDD